MKQTYTSANTSINSTKLPAIYHKIDWNHYRKNRWTTTIIDYGCGKFNNAKEFTELLLGYDWFGIDPYNRSEEENEVAYASPADVIICSNVLNVIDEDSAVQEVVDEIMMMSEMNGADCFFTVHVGDRSGEGKPTKKDCYQRNETLKQYMKFFSDYDVTIKHGVITNRPEAIF